MSRFFIFIFFSAFLHFFLSCLLWQWVWHGSALTQSGQEQTGQPTDSSHGARTAWHAWRQSTRQSGPPMGKMLTWSAQCLMHSVLHKTSFELLTIPFTFSHQFPWFSNHGGMAAKVTPMKVASNFMFWDFPRKVSRLYALLYDWSPF